MEEWSMDEIKISDMDEPVEYAAEENNDADGPIYDDDDLSSIAMPVISDMDAVVDHTAIQYDTEDIPSETEDKFSQTGDSLDSVAMPVFSDMDAVTEPAAEQTQAENTAAVEDTIDSAEAPAANDMYEETAAGNTYEETTPDPTESQVEEQTVEQPEDSKENIFSAMEKRMAEPFDMPGAYVPGEQNAPSKYVPKPPAQPAQNNSSSIQNQSETSRNNGDFLDNLYSGRQQDYKSGEKKAKILGIITIVLAILAFISSMSNERADNLDKIIAVATVIVMPLCAWKFIKGSNGSRRVLGILALFDAGDSIVGLYQALRVISILNKGLGIELRINPIIIFLSIVQAIGFAAMAYFFLLDKQVSDYTTED